MKKVFVGMALLLWSSILSFAQVSEHKINHEVAIGWPMQILSNATQGIYLAYSPVYPLNGSVALEGQIAYCFTNYSAFISGEPRRLEFMSVQGGIRLQKFKNRRKFSPYVSLMAGLSSGSKKLDFKQANEEMQKFTALSFSGGVFLDYLKKVSFGAALEYHLEPLVVFKATYVF